MSIAEMAVMAAEILAWWLGAALVVGLLIGRIARGVEDDLEALESWAPNTLIEDGNRG